MTRARASTKRSEMAARRDSDLTAEEQANVRAVLTFLRTRCGGWDGVAKALRFNATHIVDTFNGRASATASMAFRISRLVRVSVDDVVSGKFPPPHTCPHCGHVGEPVELAAS